jgi:hypothetical protein
VVLRHLPRRITAKLAAGMSPSCGGAAGSPKRAQLPECDAAAGLESLIHFDPLDLSLEVVDAGPP